jgi:hypothetical protein
MPGCGPIVGNSHLNHGGSHPMNKFLKPSEITMSSTLW